MWCLCEVGAFIGIFKQGLCRWGNVVVAQNGGNILKIVFI